MFGKRVGRVGNIGLVGGQRKGPSFALDFINGLSSGDPRLTTTRAAGGATNFNSNGTLGLSSANAQRIDYEQVRQQLPASTGITYGGASTNVISTDVPPLFPSSTVVKSTMTQSGSNTNCGALNFTPILVGIPIVVSLYVWIPSAYTGTVVSVSAEGTGVGSPTTNASLAIRDQWQRIQATGPSATSGVTNIVLRCTSANGQFIYTTAWQMEYGSTASVYQPSSASVVTTAGRGLLVEESRVNSTQNSRSEGTTNGVIGSGGVLPTNASLLNTSSLTYTVIGNGTETGLPYWDLQISGTSTNNIVRLALETTTAIAAADTQVWTNSLYCRLIGGDATNITTIQVTSAKYDNVPALIGFNGATTFSPTGAPLASQRVSNTSTLSGATIASIQGPIITLNLNSTTAVINITLRISCPQCELGAFATSPILAAVGTPAATTRASDVINASTSGWFNLAAGTLIDEVMLPQVSVSSNQDLPSLLGVGGNELLYMRQGAGGNALSAFVFSGNVNQGNTTVTAVTAGIPFKSGMTYNSGTLAVSHVLNGGAPGAVTVGIMVTAITLLQLNLVRAGATNGYVRKVRYWPRVLPTAELQTQTT